ncbi:sensor histidine kinase [Rhodobacter sp. NTK016B]|uniref:sensor histidine kinase n=1 Tax=Rhodobacter sp. NTK016B TaxID=2759676 RepID=UPI001A8C5E38|nr:ATP-binding protein [Rhodobacter sp. NTK016B]MBN8294225.1 sensor histidine kinase [Rhodobacter sp. NTK016B]
MSDAPFTSLETRLQRPHLRGRRAMWLALGMAALVIATGLGSFAYQRLYRTALEELTDQGRSTLRLAVGALNGELRRYDRLPALLAQQEVIHDLLGRPQDREQVEAANTYLATTARMMETSDIYVMDLGGTTLAASNYAQPFSFVGGNFAFRPYFLDALGYGQGRFYGLGTTSQVRGYYFGAPVLMDDEPTGVLAIKIDLHPIEESWRGSGTEVLVTDPQGIVFMSTTPAWTFGATLPLTPERLARTRATRRYADRPLAELPIRAMTGPDGGPLWRMTRDDGSTEYRVIREEMPDAGWTVQVLVDTAPARQQALTRLALGALLAGFAMLALVIVWQRRAALRERLALQDAAQAQLERRVVERTAELAAVNNQLAEEVAERTATEERLRATQADLVQAGKLAALGQMSAALSHEFNQPLGAAQNYAENAQAYIARGRVDEAASNIDRILGLVARMSELSKHLRNFARKPNAQLSDVPLAEAVDAVREILGWRLRGQNIDLRIDIPPLVVRAGPVRLQQVLVNILSNAIDALEDREARVISLSARAAGGDAVLTIADSGPGVAPQLVERIFDPFFSTKGVGKGLGLGLSISYNIVHDFGGKLSVSNAPGGGAVFTLTLPLARASVPAPTPA